MRHRRRGSTGHHQPVLHGNQQRRQRSLLQWEAFTLPQRRSATGCGGSGSVAAAGSGLEKARHAAIRFAKTGRPHERGLDPVRQLPAPHKPDAGKHRRAPCPKRQCRQHLCTTDAPTFIRKANSTWSSDETRSDSGCSARWLRWRLCNPDICTRMLAPCDGGLSWFSPWPQPVP